jgi:hypothetical protein
MTPTAEQLSAFVLPATRIVAVDGGVRAPVPEGLRALGRLQWLEGDEDAGMWDLMVEASGGTALLIPNEGPPVAMSCLPDDGLLVTASGQGATRWRVFGVALPWPERTPLTLEHAPSRVWAQHLEPTDAASVLAVHAAALEGLDEPLRPGSLAAWRAALEPREARRDDVTAGLVLALHPTRFLGVLPMSAAVGLVLMVESAGILPAVDGRGLDTMLAHGGVLLAAVVLLAALTVGVGVAREARVRVVMAGWGALPRLHGGGAGR